MRIADSLAASQPLSFGAAAPGYRLLYRDGEANHCPGCGGQNWIVGRITAECGFCHTALPRDNAHGYNYAHVSPIRQQGRTPLRLVA